MLCSLIDIKVLYACDNGLVRETFFIILSQLVSCSVNSVFNDENCLLQDFSIEYHFADNEWFSNKVLTMTYFVTCEVSEDDPWSFEGATIYACHG